MLFELLTGHPPFRGATPRDTAAMRLDRDVPAPSAVIAGVPQELDDLVLIATRRNPGQRFEDGSQFLEAVRDTVRDLGLPAFRVPVPENSAVHRALAGSVFSDRLSWDDAAMATSMVPQVTPDQHTAQTSYQEPEPPRRVEDHPTHVTRRVPEPVPAPSGPPLSNRRPVRTVLWTALVLVMVIAVAVGSWWVASGRYGEVPQVLGQDVTGARSAVEQAGFTSTVSEIWSDDDPADAVTGTDPGSGERVVRGSEVAVLVSRGRPTVPEPSDTDTLASYRSKLQDRTLTWTVGDEVWDDDAPAGVVAKVSPSSGTTVDTGTEITVQVSKGPRPVKVPGVSGMTEKKATQTLENAGLKVSGTTEEFDADVDGGDVITTDPDTDTEVPSGSEVHLVISSAVTVPDLAGKSMEDAAEALRDAGLNPVTGDAVSDTDEDAGKVAETSPTSGTRLDPARNNTVTLHPSDQVKVPFVIGKSAEDATEALEDKGFEVKIDGRSGGRVITQSPGPRTRVTEGTTVTLRTI
jgi:serine/threonine-protein kinase